MWRDFKHAAGECGQELLPSLPFRALSPRLGNCRGRQREVDPEGPLLRRERDLAAPRLGDVGDDGEPKSAPRGGGIQARAPAQHCILGARGMPGPSSATLRITHSRIGACREGDPRLGVAGGIFDRCCPRLRPDPRGSIRAFNPAGISTDQDRRCPSGGALQHVRRPLGDFAEIGGGRAVERGDPRRGRAAFRTWRCMAWAVSSISAAMSALPSPSEPLDIAEKDLQAASSGRGRDRRRGRARLLHFPVARIEQAVDLARQAAAPRRESRRQAVARSPAPMASSFWRMAASGRRPTAICTQAAAVNRAPRTRRNGISAAAKRQTAALSRAASRATATRARCSRAAREARSGVAEGKRLSAGTGHAR